MKRRIQTGFLGVTAAACLLGGCSHLDPQNWFKTPEAGAGAVKAAKAEPVTEAPAAPDGRVWVAQTGAVSNVAYLRYARPIPVRGYGVVIGLDNAGSGKCPQNIADYLEAEIQRAQAKGSGELGKLPAKELIRSPHTAAVLVEGRVPTAAVKGTTFDVAVRAVDRDVKSIAGGILLTCNLRIYSPDAPLEGRILAHASGRVFSNPFAGPDGGTGDTDPRQGRILGGGCATEDRPIQLISITPSYATVRQITQVINDRLSGDTVVADAVSPTNVTLKVPPAYRGREDRLLELILHMPMVDNAAALEARAKVLCEELTQSNPPWEDVALALEAIGPVAIPMVQKLYTHRQRSTSFYAARVGGRLGDGLAVEVLQRHAAESGGLHRQAAVRELGECAARHRLPGALTALRARLDDNDARIRIQAYESLRPCRDSVVQSRMIGRGNFTLDVLDTKGPGLIYARRTGERRIAVFGRHLRCASPLFYSDAKRPVTVTDDGDKIVIVRRTEGGSRRFEPVRTGFDVPSLIEGLGGETTPDTDGRVPGVSADYAVVLHALSILCKSNAVPAVFRMEETDIADILGPQEPQVRPESNEL